MDHLLLALDSKLNVRCKYLLVFHLNIFHWSNHPSQPDMTFWGPRSTKVLLHTKNRHEECFQLTWKVLETNVLIYLLKEVVASQRTRRFFLCECVGVLCFETHYNGSLALCSNIKQRTSCLILVPIPKISFISDLCATKQDYHEIFYIISCWVSLHTCRTTRRH